MMEVEGAWLVEGGDGGWRGAWLVEGGDGG